MKSVKLILLPITRCYFCNLPLPDGDSAYGAECDNHNIIPYHYFDTSNNVCEIVFRFNDYTLSISPNKTITLFYGHNYNYELITTIPYFFVSPESAKSVFDKLCKLKHFL